MDRRIPTLMILAAVACCGLRCTEVVFDNPLDSRGTAYAPVSLTLDTEVVFDNPLDSRGTAYAPVSLTLDGDNPLALTINDTWVEPGYSAFDVGSGGDVTAEVTVTGTVNTRIAGTYTLIYSIESAAGTVISRTRTVIVSPASDTTQDRTAPVITLIGGSTVNLQVGDSYADQGATAFDNVDGDLTDSISSSGMPNMNAAGVYTVIYTVSDRAGNEATRTRTVNVTVGPVTDTEPPVITLLGSDSMTVAQGGVFNDPGATAFDDVDGDLTDRITLTGTVNTTAPGVYTLTYRVTDASGNSDVKTRRVAVTSSDPGDDVTPPVITLTGSNLVVIELGSVYVDSGATAIDNVDGNITARLTRQDNVNTGVAGTYTVTFTATDNAGNTATKTRTVKVNAGTLIDETPPVLTLLGADSVTITAGDSWTDPGATAYDSIDGDLTDSIRTAGSVNTATAGLYRLTYTVYDLSGNMARRTRAVRVLRAPTEGLLDKYEVPAAAALPSIDNLQCATITTEGDAPDVSAITKFTLNWNLANNGLYQFAFNYTANPYYMDFSGTLTQNFNQPQPGFTITGTGVTGLDGAYYITKSGSSVVWVRTDGSFAIVFAQ